MLRKLSGHLGKNVVAYLALFVALGGTSIAAVSLKRGSVKGKHIAKNAVTSPKVKNASLRAADFAPGQLPAGQQGAQGPQGPPGTQASDANTLDGQDSSAFLGVNAKAADANALDGKDSLGFARLGGRVSVGGVPDRPGYTVTKGTAGIYTVNLPAGTLSATGTSCVGPVPIITPFSSTQRRAIVTLATCSVTDGSGNFTVELYDSANAKADSQFFFIVL